MGIFVVRDWDLLLQQQFSLTSLKQSVFKSDCKAERGTDGNSSVIITSDNTRTGETEGKRDTSYI